MKVIFDKLQLNAPDPERWIFLKRKIDAKINLVININVSHSDFIQKLKEDKFLKEYETIVEESRLKIKEFVDNYLNN